MALVKVAKLYYNLIRIKTTLALLNRRFANRSRISSVGRALDCRAGGRVFDSRGRTNTQARPGVLGIRYPGPFYFRYMVFFGQNWGIKYSVFPEF